MKNIHLLGLFLLSLLFTACQTIRSLPGSDPIEFTILQINDVYEIAPIEGGAAGGLARVAQVKKDLLKENPNTISVLAGDFLSPSLIATLKLDGEPIAGLQMVQALNAMGLDYATFGNHEFDLSSAELLQSRIDQSDFEYVCANAFYTDGEMVQPFTQSLNGQKREVPPYAVHTFAGKNGKQVKVAIIGVVLPFNKANYVRYTPVEEAFRKAYEAARKEADIVLGLTHLNMEDDIALAKAVPGSPLFMGGHEHVNLNHYVEGTIITKADANAKTAYVHRIQYDPISGFHNIRSTLLPINEKVAEDPVTKAVVDRWQGQVNSILVDMGYHPDRALMIAQEPLICTEALIRTQPTNYGELTCAAIGKAFPEADIPLLNSGSMRLDDNLVGTVVEYDVLRTYPFGGPLVQMEVPGAALNTILNTGLIANQGEGGYFQIANVSGEANNWLIKGKKLAPDQTYTLALPEFVAQGNEARLEIFADYTYVKKDKLMMDGQEVDNDLRNVVIAYMGGR
ncbi:MAG TPA: bifunctional metallophosphatase/5'-nucleotidase [Saprospiraceae bacterium]|nr:bifunctional metallophosphatase/5'-nucleotidase [Saprospiraceae bacterium]